MIQIDVNKILNLLENTDTGFYILDQEFRFVHSNESFLQALGVKSLSNIKGASVLDWIDPDYLEAFKTFLNRCMKEGSYNNLEIVFLSRDNVISYFLQSAIVEEAVDGLHISVICWNITRRKIIEENLKRAKEKAEESDKLKTAFLSNLSHEIRTPMNSIIGFSELLTKQETPIEQKQNYLNYINNSGTILLNLIDDIIDIAKIQSGQLNIKKQKVVLDHLLFDIYSSYVQLCKSKKGDEVAFLWNQRNKYGSIKLHTDPLRLRQIFTNLLGNALKFTDKGSIEFGYYLESIKDKECLLFYVKDTGIGLSSQNKELIFTRFYKIEDDSMKLYRGAGLGLAITKSLVSLLDGTIWVDSEIGRGSTFYFALPIKDVEISVQTDVRPADKEISLQQIGNKVVLVAEDEDINYIYIEEILRKYNANVIRAKNGLEAVEKVRNNKIDLVLMDIKMPVMDGYQATEQIKAIYDKLPVVAQTAFAFSEEKDKIISCGCNDYIAKPIKPNELLKILSKYLV